MSIQPRLKKRLGKLQLPHNALVGNASLLQKDLDLLLGIFPRQPLLIAALQVLQGSLAVQLRNRERRPLIQKALRDQILARHRGPRRSECLLSLRKEARRPRKRL